MKNVFVQKKLLKDCYTVIFRNLGVVQFFGRCILYGFSPRGGISSFTCEKRKEGKPVEWAEWGRAISAGKHSDWIRNCSDFPCKKSKRRRLNVEHIFEALVLNARLCGEKQFCISL